MERLQKHLAHCGVASRRGAEKLIEGGHVTVNGETATLGMSVDPAQDRVEVDGGPVGQEAPVYILLNKPPDVVTTVKDTHDRDTVLDCLTGISARVYPVGRLDMDVGGVLFLTNDGELANRLIHPRYKIPKVYHAWVWGTPDENALQRLRQGVMLEDGMTAPALAEIIKVGSHRSLLRLEIYEGKKREVKRMCIAIDHRVAELTRISFAGLRIGDLKPGEWRHLSEDEVNRLRQSTPS